MRDESYDASAEQWSAASSGHLDDFVHHDAPHCGDPHYEAHCVVRHYWIHCGSPSVSWSGAHCGYVVPHVGRSGAHHGDQCVHCVAHYVSYCVDRYVELSGVVRGGGHDWDVGYDEVDHQQWDDVEYDTGNVVVQQSVGVDQWVEVDQGADEHCDVEVDDVGQGHCDDGGGDGRGR